MIKDTEFHVTIKLVDTTSGKVLDEEGGRMPISDGYVTDVAQWAMEKCIALKMKHVFGEEV